MELVEPGVAIEHHLIRELHDPASLDSRVLDLLGVRYVVSNALNLNGFERIFGSVAERLAIHERPHVLRTVTSPQLIRFASTSKDVLKAMGANNYQPDQETWITTKEAKKLGLVEDRQQPWVHPLKPPEFSLKSYEPTELRVSYDSATEFPLRIADSFHPGWTCRLESGKVLPIARTDHNLRLILVPPGKGVVTFSFESNSFRVGLILAGVGLLLMTLLGGICALRGGRRPKGGMD
jgi:hypothetical protein